MLRLLIRTGPITQIMEVDEANIFTGTGQLA
jgi:hypothetical protein